MHRRGRRKRADQIAHGSRHALLALGAGLAHPLRYPDPGAALELAADLDAVEVHYPYDGSRGHSAATGALDTRDVAAVADEHDLLVTGGSDAHERDLGGEGLSADEYERFAAALAG